MSDIVVDLLAALGGGIQAEGLREVDNLSPSSTRGTAEGSGPARRRQPGRAYVRAERAPAWPEFHPHGSLNQQRWDAWRAEVAARTWAADARDGAPSTAYVPDTDEVVEEQKRTRVYLVVRDGDGVVWRDCPEWEVDDLPQPVIVLARDERRVYPAPKPKPAPIVVLAEAKVDKRKQRSVMSDDQIAFALDLMKTQPVGQIADRYWREWGFASAKSCDFSLRRRRGMAAQQAKFREEAAA